MKFIDALQKENYLLLNETFNELTLRCRSTKQILRLIINEKCTFNKSTKYQSNILLYTFSVSNL